MAKLETRNTLGAGNPVVNKRSRGETASTKTVAANKKSGSGKPTAKAAPDMGRASKNILAAGERLKSESAARNSTAMTRKEAREAAAKRGEAEFEFGGVRYNTRWGGEVAAYKKGTGDMVAKKTAPKNAPRAQVAKATQGGTTKKASKGSTGGNLVERKYGNTAGTMVARNARNVKADESSVDKFKRDMALPNAVNKDSLAASKALKSAAKEDRTTAIAKGPKPNTPATRRSLVEVVKDSRKRYINSLPSSDKKPRGQKI